MTKTRKVFIGLFLGMAGVGVVGCIIAILWFVVAMISGAPALLPLTISWVGLVMLISGWSIVLILNRWKWGETPGSVNER